MRKCALCGWSEVVEEASGEAEGLRCGLSVKTDRLGEKSVERFVREEQVYLGMLCIA